MEATDKGDWSIAEVVEKLGVSEKTVRRHIQEGNIKAEMRPGTYGMEWHILEMPDLKARARLKDGLQDEVDRLRKENGELHELLGAARLRIGQLENDIKLLEAPKARPWWKRLFGIA